jgi:hypothetical protein
VVGTCECGNEPSGGEFLELLRMGQLLKKEAA